MRQLLSFSFVLIFSTLALANTQGVSCQSLLSGGAPSQTSEPKLPIYSRLPVNLRDLYNNEIKSISKKEINRRNQRVQDLFENFVPPKNGKRAKELSHAQFVEVYAMLEREFTGQNMDQYDQAHCKIGYCFGRAYLAHMILLKMGLQQDSIRKVWAVGKMNSGTDHIMWDFHVATTAYVKDYGWMVLDTNFNQPLPLRDWFNKNLSESVDGNVRLYVTDAKKFAITVGQYSSSELGFKLPRDADWYKGYFVDNTKTIRNTPIEKIED